jgi:hypothetical protein
MTRETIVLSMFLLSFTDLVIVLSMFLLSFIDLVIVLSMFLLSFTDLVIVLSMFLQLTKIDMFKIQSNVPYPSRHINVETTLNFS